MKLKIYGRKAVIIESTDNELQELKQTLTWEKKSFGYQPFPDVLLYKSKTYWFYAGLIDLLKDKFTLEIEGSYKPIDETKHDLKNVLGEKIKLYPFQKIAVEACLKHKQGVIKIPTGGGKTIVMQAVLKHLIKIGKIKKAIVTVPSVALAEQFVQRSLDLGFSEDDIGIYYGKKKEFKKIIVAVSNSLFQTLDAKKPDIEAYVKDLDLLMFDETHHLAAKTWSNVAYLCSNCEYLFGFSGTPFTNNEGDYLQHHGDALIYGICSGVILDVPHFHLRNLDLLAHPKVSFIEIDGDLKRWGKWQDVYTQYVVNDEKRNSLILDAVNKLKQKNLKTLVLLQRKEHIKDLLVKLNDYRAVGVLGNGEGYEVEDGRIKKISINYEQLKVDFDKGGYNTLFATQVFDEGVDIPAIQAVVMAGAGKSYKKIAQRVGRGLRAKKDGKNEVYIVDFIDKSHKFLYNQSIERYNFYKQIDAEISLGPKKFLG